MKGKLEVVARQPKEVFSTSFVILWRRENWGSSTLVGYNNKVIPTEELVLSSENFILISLDQIKHQLSHLRWFVSYFLIHEYTDRSGNFRLASEISWRWCPQKNVNHGQGFENDIFSMFSMQLFPWISSGIQEITDCRLTSCQTYVHYKNTIKK